ncbi:MAG: hypothetical protein ACE5EO_03475 [Candidatus Krumholzibacteriia bacterium]
MSSRQETYRAARVIALILLTVACYALPWRRAGAEVVGLPLLLLQTLGLPGYILLRTLRWRARDPLEVVAGSFLLGLAYFLALAFIAAAAGIPLATFGKILPVAVVAVAGLEWWRPAGGKPRPLAGGAGWAVVLTGVLIVTFVLVLRAGAPLGHTKDTLDHVGYVAEIRDSGEAFPRTEFYAENDDNGRDIRKGLLHVFYAFTSGLLGIEPLRFFDIMAALLTVMLALAVYSMATGFFDDRRVAVLSTIFFLIGPGGITGSAIRTSFYPNRFGIAFFFFFLIYGLAFIRNRDKRDAAAAAVLAFAASATHVFYAVAVVFAGLIVKLWKIYFPWHSAGEHMKRVMTLGLSVVLAMAPFTAYRYVTASPEANELHRQIQGVLFVTPTLYVADPIRLLTWLGPLGVVSFLALLPLWRERQNHAGLGYAMASLLTIPLVLFNPLLLPVLHKVMTYLVFRLNVVCPFYVLPAFFLVRWFARRRPGARRGGWSHVLTGLILIAVAVQLKPLASAALDHSRVEREQAHSYRMWEDGLQFLSALPGRAVIASDPVTSYSIPAFTQHHVVCTLDQHAPPNDLRVEERIGAARDIMSPFVSARRTAELIRTHGVTHVVLNQRFREPTGVHYWSVDPAVYAEARNKFVGQPDLFETLFDRDGFVVLRPAAADPGDAPPLNRYYVDSIPGAFERVGRHAGTAFLEGVSIAGTDVERGGVMELALVWSSARRHPLANYVVSIRFDHADPRLPLAGRPFPKLVRKGAEALRGERYRFRAAHKIAGGLLGPDAWPEGQLVLDRSRVRIPKDVAPGEYTVAVKLLAVANQPNYRLHDLFYDDDLYDAPPVGRVVIR